jgi:hypothetical protein
VSQTAFAAVEQYLESGKVVPVIDHVFPLEQAADAFAMLERGGAVGKILIKVRPAVKMNRTNTGRSTPSSYPRKPGGSAL